MGMFVGFSDLSCAVYAGTWVRVLQDLSKDDMESTLVRRVVHKPTDAAFTPYPGDPHSGIVRTGQLGNELPNGSGFRPDDVHRMMRELWTEYVVGNPQLFPPKTE